MIKKRAFIPASLRPDVIGEKFDIIQQDNKTNHNAKKELLFKMLHEDAFKLKN